jgi:hypothetical protein
MRYGRKIVLHCLSGYKPELDEMVEQFLRDGVVFVGVLGKDCSRVEDIIGELVVGDGNNETRFILTSFHEDESLDEAIDFAKSLSGEYAGEIQVVQL